MKNPDPDKTCERKFAVPFHDLDPMQVMWHGNYLKYFDITRDALFRKLGIDLYQAYKDTRYIFPIIRTSIKHVSPLRFRDEFICRAVLKDVNYKITVAFEIRVAEDNRVSAKGQSEQAAVKTPEMETMLKIPEHIRKALGF
ncbi:MAG: acyl-CoA thioesterase [Desulfobacteraceae bacterium]|nr:acyl-CoA thioesterase [Desulfobacteraceae bacterium]MCF8094582.1 acyl-CoA thioesterase [Desulfobacteraceae bacterium]